MDESNRLPGWLRSGLIGLGLFLAGGALAFGYSYRPLHGALSWKVEALEQRLDERNRELLKQSDELARLRSDDAERIDPERFAKIERELETTKSALAQAETDLERAEKKRKDANASASRWRKRYEEMRDHATRTAAAPPVVQEPSPRAGPASRQCRRCRRRPSPGRRLHRTPPRRAGSESARLARIHRKRHASAGAPLRTRYPLMTRGTRTRRRARARNLSDVGPRRIRPRTRVVDRLRAEPRPSGSASAGSTCSNVPGSEPKPTCRARRPARSRVWRRFRPRHALQRTATGRATPTERLHPSHRLASRRVWSSPPPTCEPIAR